MSMNFHKSSFKPRQPPLHPTLCIHCSALSVLSRRIIRQSLKYWQLFIQHIFRSIEKTFRVDKVPCFVIHQFFMSRISRFLNMKHRPGINPLNSLLMEQGREETGFICFLISWVSVALVIVRWDPCEHSCYRSLGRFIDTFLRVM